MYICIYIYIYISAFVFKNRASLQVNIHTMFDLNKSNCYELIYPNQIAMNYIQFIHKILSLANLNYT